MRFLLLGGIFFVLTSFAAPGPELPTTAGIKALATSKVWLNALRPPTEAELKGRVLLLAFWTHGAVNSLHILPDLDALEKEFGTALTVIAVHSAKFDSEKDRESVRSAVLRHGISHRVANDSSFAIWNAYHVRAWPTLVVVNPHGEVEKTYTGEGQREKLRQTIRGLVSDYKDSLNSAPLPIAAEKEDGAGAVLRYPGKIHFAPDVKGESILFISDSGNHRVLGVVAEGPDAGTVRYRAGGKSEAGNHDGTGAESRFHSPQGLLFIDGALWIADSGNHALRRFDLASGQVTTVAGTGQQGVLSLVQDADPLDTALSSPWDLALFPTKTEIAIAMAGTHQIWSYHLERKKLSAVAGGGAEGTDEGKFPANSLAQPMGLAAGDGVLYFVDAQTSALRAWRDGKVENWIGRGPNEFGFKDGLKAKALMQHPESVYADASGIYVADSFNHSIRRYDPKTGRLENFAGDGHRGREMGQLQLSRFNEPGGLARIGDSLFIADTNNHRIQMLDMKKKAVRSFPVREETEGGSRRFSHSLPRVVSLPTQKLRFGVPIAVDVRPSGEWIWNEKAPTYLALFEMGGEPRLVEQWPAEAIRGNRVHLSALRRSKHYRLQGVFPVCSAKDVKICHTESRDVDLQGIKKSKQRSLKLW